MKFLTLDEVNFDGRVVLLRIDINSPIDRDTGEIMDTTRFEQHVSTIKDLHDSRLVIMAHQGRPGEYDFTSLEQHAEVLGECVENKVTFIDDIFGPSAREAIRNLKRGEALLLENVRYYSEENLSRPPEVQAKTALVRNLSPLADLYVNDAFSAAHRSQPSLVGFPMVLPSAGGRQMEEEIAGLSMVVEEPRRPAVYLLGGVKYEDAIELTDHVLRENIADQVLVAGAVALVFLTASGVNLGKARTDLVRHRGYLGLIHEASRLLSTYEDRIILPVDVAVEEDEGRVEVPVDELPVDAPIWDIGHETMDLFADLIKQAGTVVHNGPAGKFEDMTFSVGSRNLFRAMADSDAFTVVGGGHTTAALRRYGKDLAMDLVSTGGGAMLSLLAGKRLPAVEALELSAKRVKEEAAWPLGLA